MPRKKGRRGNSGVRKQSPKNAQVTEPIAVDLNLVKNEPLELPENGHGPIDKLEVHLDKIKNEPTSPPVVPRKSGRLRVKRTRSSAESLATQVQEELPKLKSPAPPISSGIKLPKLSFDGSDDDEDEEEGFPFHNGTNEQAGSHGPKNGSSTTTSPGSGRNTMVHLPPTAINYEEMSPEQLLEKVKTLALNYDVDQQTICELQKTHGNQLRAVTLLEQENEKLRECSKNYQILSEKERWRAEDAWKKLETTKLYNKATEEGTAQRYFLQQKYAEAMDEVRTGCEKRLKELEKDRAMLARENSTLTRNMTRSKENHTKLKKKLNDLKSLVRVFSSALSEIVDMDDVDSHLGVLGGSLIKRYRECMEDKQTSKELNVARLIAGERRSKPRNQRIKHETSDSDPDDEFVNVNFTSVESESVAAMLLDHEPAVNDSSVISIKKERLSPPHSPLSSRNHQVMQEVQQHCVSAPAPDPPKEDVLIKVPVKEEALIKPPPVKEEAPIKVAGKEEVPIKVAGKEEVPIKVPVKEVALIKPPLPKEEVPIKVPGKEEALIKPPPVMEEVPVKEDVLMKPPPVKEEVTIKKEVVTPPVSPPAGFISIKKEISTPPESASSEDELMVMVNTLKPITMEEETASVTPYCPSIFDPETPIQNLEVGIKVEKTAPPEECPREILASMPELFGPEPKAHVEPQLRPPMVCKPPSMWQHKIPEYRPPPPQNKYTYNPAPLQFPIARDYDFGPSFRLVSPIVTPPIRRREASVIPTDNQVIEFSPRGPPKLPTTTDKLASLPPILNSLAGAEAAQESSADVLNCAFLASSSTENSQEIKPPIACSTPTEPPNIQVDESYEAVNVAEADPDNPYITHWDSDKSERFTPPLIPLPIRRKHETRRHPRGHRAYSTQRRVNDRSQRVAPRIQSPPMSVRSRVNRNLGPVNPKNGSNQCEKLRLDSQIRDKQAKKREHSNSSSSSDEKTQAKVPRMKYSMTDLFGDDEDKSYPPIDPPMKMHSPLSDYADNESSDMSEDNKPVVSNLEISDYEDEIQPPASPDPQPEQPAAMPMRFDVNPGLLSYLMQLLGNPLDNIVSAKTNLEVVEANELAAALYSIMVQTKRHEYEVEMSNDPRVTVCPLIPRFQSLFAIVKKLPERSILAFLEFFKTQAIPSKFREIENDQLVMNIGRFIGAISLGYNYQDQALDLLLYFQVYRPPFAYSFAHGLLCSDSSVIGYNDFWQFQDLDRKRQAILFTIFKNPRFGDARYAKPVIEMIKRSLNINVPDLTYDQFLWKFVEQIFEVESDRELQTCAHVLAMFVIQNGLAFFEGPFTTRFYEWTTKWSSNLINDGVFASFINTVGIIAEALRRNDIPTTTEKQQGVLSAVGKIVNAPALIKDCVSKSIAKLRSAVVSNKFPEDWIYEKRWMPGAPPSAKKKKFKKFVKQDAGDKKQGTWVRGSRKSPNKRSFGKGDRKKRSWNQQNKPEAT